MRQMFFAVNVFAVDVFAVGVFAVDVFCSRHFAVDVFATDVFCSRHFCGSRFVIEEALSPLYYKALREVAHLRELEYVRFVTAIHTKVPQAKLFAAA